MLKIILSPFNTYFQFLVKEGIIPQHNKSSIANMSAKEIYERLLTIYERTTPAKEKRTLCEDAKFIFDIYQSNPLIKRKKIISINKETIKFIIRNMCNPFFMRDHLFKIADFFSGVADPVTVDLPIETLRNIGYKGSGFKGEDICIYGFDPNAFLELADNNISRIGTLKAGVIDSAIPSNTCDLVTIWHPDSRSFLSEENGSQDNAKTLSYDQILSKLQNEVLIDKKHIEQPKSGSITTINDLLRIAGIQNNILKKDSQTLFIKILNIIASPVDSIVQSATDKIKPGGWIYIAPNDEKEFHNDHILYAASLLKQNCINIKIKPFPDNFPKGGYGKPKWLVIAQKQKIRSS